MKVGLSRVEEKEDDYKKYRLVWSSSCENYAFATFRTVVGKNYKDVNYIINKPHGYKKVIYKMLAFLIIKDRYRWSTFEKKFNLDNNFEDIITILLNAGIIEIKEKNKKPAKREEWIRAEISLDKRAINDIQLLCRGEESFETWKSKLLFEIKEILYGVKNSKTEVEKLLDKCIQDGINKLNGRNSNFPCNIRSRKKYKSFLITLAYSRHLIYYNKSMPLRTLSSIIWDDSKILDNYIDEILSYTGIKLKELGITTHPEVIWLFGAGEYILDNKFTTSLMAGRPIILSEETIEQSEFKASKDLRNIVIVENLTVFMMILQKEYYKRLDTIVIWSHGYWNSNHKRILLDILSTSLNEIMVYIWCDIDIDGLMIASNIYNWTFNNGGIPQFILMEEESYNLCKGKRKLTEREAALINSRTINENFISLKKCITECGVTVEQEKLLDHYEYVKSKLP